MDSAAEKIAELVASLQNADDTGDSCATSPGPGPRPEISETMEDPKKVTRNRPRTYPYIRYLPYRAESEAKRQEYLEDILKYLYIAVESGDFVVGAVHWTRELRNWMSLKFDLTKEQRVKLVRLYYELSLAPGVDVAAVERFSSTFNALLK